MAITACRLRPARGAFEHDVGERRQTELGMSGGAGDGAGSSGRTDDMLVAPARHLDNSSLAPKVALNASVLMSSVARYRVNRAAPCLSRCPPPSNVVSSSSS